MKEFKIQYLLAEQLDDFRKNILYSDQSLKYCKKFNKEKNGGIYKSFCLFSFIYILLLQAKAFYQNNLSAVGMLFLTTFFLIYILVCWKKPILKIQELGALLSPFLVIKLTKKYSDSNNVSLKDITQIIAKRILFFSILIVSILFFFECGKSYSNFNYNGNFGQNFFNDIFVWDAVLSSNIFLNYFFVISVLCFLLAIFSNPFYCFERNLIRKKIEGKGYFDFIWVIVVGIVLLLSLNSNYLLYLLKNLNEIFLITIVVLLYLAMFLLSFLYFYLVCRNYKQ